MYLNRGGHKNNNNRGRGSYRGGRGGNNRGGNGASRRNYAKFDNNGNNNSKFSIKNNSYAIGDDPEERIFTLDPDNDEDRIASAKSDREAYREERRVEDERIDDKFGFVRYAEGPQKLGWLLNMRTTTIEDEESKESLSAVDFYFIEPDGSTFKATQKYEPYFYVLAKDNYETEVTSVLKTTYENYISKIEVVEKEDLDMPNHLSGALKKYIRISFRNVSDLTHVRGELFPVVEKNKKDLASSETYWNDEDIADDYMQCIIDMREYDIPYHIRVSIDRGLRVGNWYNVKNDDGDIQIIPRPDLVERAEPRVCAFDIETTKQPLKFPDAETDQIMMISYMVDRQGYLIINREIVSEDIEDFEFTPKPEYEGPFTVYNEPDEAHVLQRFFAEMQEIKPTIYVTFNGDYFDFPFIDRRAAINGMNMRKEIGYSKDREGVYSSRYGIHMDCLYWVKRDSYLPQGSHGLKAVAKAKLGFDPLEIHPEDMVRFASEKPQLLASYSVSDAVATFYLYMKHIHPFIFSLCTIIPMSPDEVLRKGSGTLCESLLMVEAYSKNIIAPNKHKDDPNKMYNGHLLESETYIGGHVECLQSGVFRNDLKYKFTLDKDTYKQLMDTLDATLKFAIEVEAKLTVPEITNYEEIKQEILTRLGNLYEEPNRLENPLIYHLDVAAMYPNIILTNRLQPCAIVNETLCAACVHNKPENNCKRKMKWDWRGQFYKANRSEYENIKKQLEIEKFPPKYPNGPQRSYSELSQDEQLSILKSRLSVYSRKVYTKTFEKKEEEKEATICQRENPFYVDTVRLFRDRRYEYKELHKHWKGKADAAAKKNDADALASASNMIVLYESMQLAHKCILNSFYGYVMRRGARWYSMEMAGVVTRTGSEIIKMARQLIDKIGQPLELDTDGIWCMLPKTFPENFVFKTNNPSKPKFVMSYPCTMLNVKLDRDFANPQYQELVDPVTREYSIRREHTIFFEVDGPYKAMVLPASKEEGKGIKKRYAVFNHNDTLAELKGFEIKRRGELKLIKLFQSQVFEGFLKGNTLEACYEAVGQVANRWLDILYTEGAKVEDEELFELCTEGSTMSRTVEEYDKTKSLAISTAKRLAEFLGDQMIKDKGLACNYVVSKKPEGAPVTERAIPVAIFSAEKKVQAHYLKRWLKDSSITEDNINIRNILDWQYYITRLGSTIQKIITIPAAFQKVDNPVPRIAHPAWLKKRVDEMNDTYKQQTITSMFKVLTPSERERERGRLADEEKENKADGLNGAMDIDDMENLGDKLTGTNSNKVGLPRVTVHKSKRQRDQAADVEDAKPSAPVPEIDRKFFGAGSAPLNAEFWEHPKFDQWLNNKKRKWKQLREAKKKRRAGEDDGEDFYSRNGISSGSGSRTDMASYMKQQSLSLVRKPWQILQMRESIDNPGVVKFFVLVDNLLQVVNVKVPRRFYINTRVVDEGAKKVSFVLPRSRPCLNLYKHEVPEAKFKEFSKQMNSHLTHPDIEGVYETQISLVFNSLIELGCVCAVNPSARKKLIANSSNKHDYTLEDLSFQSTDQVPYLSPEDTNLRRIYMYHSLSDNRGVIGVFFYATNTAKIYIIQPFIRAERPNLNWKRMLGSQQQQLQQTQGSQPSQNSSSSQTNDLDNDNDEETANAPSAAPSFVGQLDASLDFDFKVEYVVDRRTAFSRIQDDLYDYLGAKRGPTVLISQLCQKSTTNVVTATLSNLEQSSASTESITREMIKHIPAMDNFPVITMPAHEEDCAYPALGWIKFCSQRMLRRFLTVDPWLENQIQLARYAHVPIGNIEADYPVFVLDLFYSRTLRKNNHLLWISESNKPDLGGLEEDDSVLLASEEELNNARGVEISNPGSYHNICVELELLHLDVDTILESHQIHAIEGTEESGQAHLYQHQTLKSEDGQQAAANDQQQQQQQQQPHQARRNLLVDESILCASAFKLLKSLVNVWFTDAGVNGNAHADLLLFHLYRWLRSPHAKLYEPALHRMIHKMMKKVFMQLLAEFKKLGSQIVYANFNRIIICTPKDTKEDAEAYVDFILKTIRHKPLFMWLDFVSQRLWGHLLFMDTSNYGGYLLADKGNATVEKPAVACWNIVDYLPKILQNDVNGLLAAFPAAAYLKKKELWQQAQQARRALAENSSGSNNSSSNNNNNNNDANNSVKEVLAMEKDIRKAVEKELRNRITSFYTPQLLKFIENFQQMSRMNGYAEASQFPVLPGSHRPMTNAPLEVVKTICHVLGLEKAVTEEVSAMKKTLLKLLSVGSFSKEAEFENPCRTFVLPDVICSYCNTCKDLDLCRDPCLTGKMSNNSSSSSSNDNKWRCSECNHLYNKNLIEMRLVEYVELRSLGYQVQDLICQKSKTIKADNMATFSEVSGRYRNKESSPQEFLASLAVFHNIAVHHKFDWLRETVEWMIKMGSR